MGGTGSGRRCQIGAETTEDYRSIDVRWLKREGLLSPGVSRRITWSRRNEIVASIGIAAEPGRIVLSYRHRSEGEDWQDKLYPVQLTTTPCNMGGERHWFICPARGCSRRVAILYCEGIFACRRCNRLTYPSQRETPPDRAVRRADRIRDRLNWPGGILEGGDWGKPKGMHRRTYERLCKEHDAFSDQALVGMIDHLTILAGREPF